MSALLIESCAACCSIQDAGRTGWRRIGFPRSGALDRLALATANVLVGNAQDCAGIELLIGGMTLRVLEGSMRFALAGSEFPVSVDDIAIPNHTSFLAHAGQRVVIGTARRGACGFLAVEGGVDVPLALGSRSLHARSGVGGAGGRFLMPGDHLRAGEADTAREEVRLPPLPINAEEGLRVVLGPQADYFSQKTIDTLLSATFKVTAECDRMAFRLEGPALKQLGQRNLVSDGVFEGAIQITNAGQPIVMLADHQTIGGYPKIAAIVESDIRFLANRLPGETVKFRAVSVQDAQAEYRRAKADLATLHSRLRPCSTALETLALLDFDAIADNAVNAVDAESWDWPGLSAQIVPVRQAEPEPA